MSDRELAVLGSIADGRSNEGAARDLGVSVKTIEAACRSVFQKLELRDSRLVNRRVQAVRFYLEHGPAPESGRGWLRATETFVGRADELQCLDELLRRHRNVTMVGPGGSGKTALAVALCGRRARRGESVWFVDLVPGVDRVTVVDALCDAFGVVARNTEASLRRVRARIGDGPAVIVLDNAEHVGGHVSWMIDQLDLDRGVEVLVTSRSALRRPTEVVWPLPSLRPAECAELLASRLTTELDDGAMAALCESADGLPLALELLASRVSSFGVESVLARLDRLPTLLRSAAGGRHASVSTALGASYETLSPVEQQLFRALSVFPVGLTSDALEVFCAGRFGDARLTAEAICDISLARREGMRLRMLEPVRQYAAELLDCHDETTTAERSLIAWAVEVAARVPVGAASSDDTGWRHAFAENEHGVARALECAIDGGDAAAAQRIGVAVCEYRANGKIGRGYALVRRALALSEADTPTRTDLLLGAGRLATQLNRPETAELLNDALAGYLATGSTAGAARAAEALTSHSRRIDDGRRAVELADAAGVGVVQAWSRVFLANGLWRHDAPPDEILALLDDAERLATNSGSRHGAAGAQVSRAAYRIRAGSPADDVVRDLDSAESTLSALGDHWNLVDCLHQRAALHLRDGDGRAAWRPARRGLELCLTSIDDPIALCDAVFDAAGVFALTGSSEFAASTARAAARYNETLPPLWVRPVHAVVEALPDARADPASDDDDPVAALYRAASEAESALVEAGSTV